MGVAINRTPDLAAVALFNVQDYTPIQAVEILFKYCLLAYTVNKRAIHDLKEMSDMLNKDAMLFKAINTRSLN
jgi:hypothetical protein